MPEINQFKNTNKNGKGSGLVPVKVIDIILDMDHPMAESLGGWDSLGTILYLRVDELVDNPQLESDQKVDGQGRIITSLNRARPLYANHKYYPLKGEIVLVGSFTGKDIDKDTFMPYYFPNLNIWNHSHHNALPNPDVYNQEGDKNKTRQDYTNTVGGLVRHITDKSTEIPLGLYFREQLNTKPLLPFEGDHIIEGRYGNSIRFGATAPTPNDWSTVGQVGDPITIIRNGQSDELDDKGWEPTVEDVNRDMSTIYLTSTQKLDKFVPASLNWQSWGAEPTVIQDPIEALSNPPIETVTEPTEVVEETDETAWGSMPEDTGSAQVNEEEDTTTTPPPPPEEATGEKDELSLYDELIASGDYDEDDFEEILSLESVGDETDVFIDIINPDGSIVQRPVEISPDQVTESGNLKIPLLNQMDPKWKDVKTWLNGSSLICGPSGCCLTSCAMVASYVLNRIVTPLDLMGPRNKDKDDNTPKGSGVLVEWNKVGNYMGLSYTPKYKSSKPKSKQAVVDYLVAKIDAKIPVIWEKQQSGVKKSGKLDGDYCEKIVAYGQSGEKKINAKYVFGNQHWMVISGYNPSTTGGFPTFQVSDPSGAAMRMSVPIEHLKNTLGRFVTWE
jgi:hypothetical protein